MAINMEVGLRVTTKLELSHSSAWQPNRSDRRQRWGCVGSLQLVARDHAWVFIFKQPYGKSLTDDLFQ